VQPDALEAWRQGIWLDHRPTRPAEVTVIARGRNQTQLEVVLQEGRNRQIRRVAQALGYRVLDLHRTAVGSVELGNLNVGSYRALSSAEIEALLAESSVQSPPLTKLPPPSVSHSPS
jgi:pseudouridine synthase